MKTISLLTLSILFTVSLFARENPFEPTDHFIEQKQLILKKNEQEKLKKEQEEKDRITMQKVEAQINANQKAKVTPVKLDAVSTTKVGKEVETKPYIPAIQENFQVLPFVKISILNDVLTLKVDPKYQLLNQDILKPVKKFLFDFQGKESFYTIRKEILSKDYKSFAVGTHKEEKFFRVVIDLTDEMISYTETIDSKNGIITIRKK
jgi:hypothetical protein